MQSRLTHPPRIAAAKAGFSTATAYRLEQQGIDPDPAPKAPRGRRRPDPLAGIFDEEIVPLLQTNPGLRSIALFDELRRRHPELTDGVRRTLERRVRAWRAIHGPQQDVIFRQRHQPGDMGLSDFTSMDDCGVIIDGTHFNHLLYHFRLPYSGFEHAEVIPFGETYVALAEGLQNALWVLGGVPRQHRTDSLSAAFRNLERAARDDLTSRYEALCAHYGMTPTRNNPGIAHENGSVESAHGHLKRAIEDALMLRGSQHFDHYKDYRAFIAELVSRRNARVRDRIDAERATLQPLPCRRTTDYERVLVRVTSSGGFRLRKVFYTVPSRLIGHQLCVHLYHDRLVLFVGNTELTTLVRGHPDSEGNHGHVIDYRDVIHALRRKPMALQNLVYRDALFPRPAYRRTYDVLLTTHGPAVACRRTTELLFLAYERGCEVELATLLEQLLDAGIAPDPALLHARLAPRSGVLPQINVPLAPLATYDALLHVACTGGVA